MTIVVRPFMTARNAAWISRSVEASTDARGLVEDQDPRVGDERPGEGDALALAARERKARSPTRCRSRRERVDEALGLGHPRGRPHLLVGGLRAP